MKTSPRSDYPVRVIPEEQEHDDPEAVLFAGAFRVGLNHDVTVRFVPDISAAVPPWDEAGLPPRGELPETREQALQLTASFARYVVTPNALLAGTVERFLEPWNNGEPWYGVAFYVSPEDFERYTADLVELAEVAWREFDGPTVSQLRGYGVIRFIEGTVLTSPELDRHDALLLGLVAPINRAAAPAPAPAPLPAPAPAPLPAPAPAPGRADGGGFRSAVTVELAQDLDLPKLTALRESLRLTPEGRYADAWDQIQGRRVEDVPGGRVRVLLIRSDVPGPWSVHLDVDGDLAGRELAQVEQEVVSALGTCDVPVGGVARRR